MKHKRIMAGLAALVLTLGLAGCGGQDAASSMATSSSAASSAPPEADMQATTDSHYPVTITNYDYAGNEVS